jgi:arylsulfatase A-like enzyme
MQDTFGKTHYYDPLNREFDTCVDMPEHHDFLSSLPPRRIPAGVNILGPWRPFDDPASVWLNADCLPYCFDEEMPDTFFVDNAVRYLSEKRSKPFFLWIGFFVTHSPFRFPIEFEHRFDPNEFAVPDVHPNDEPYIPSVFRDLTRREKQGIIAAYHTSVAYMDRNVGSILKALESTGLANDTLVIFNSDHGYLLGEHGRFEKHCCYEEAVRSALVMRYPEVIAPGRSMSPFVELIDIVPTILELCGIKIPSNIQGRSLARAIKGEATDHREHVISEYSDNAEAMVRTDGWKLIHSAGNRRRRDGYATSPAPPWPSTRLYHLIEDPSELRNVSNLAENREIVDCLFDLLVRHVKTTARNPGMLPDTDDPMKILDQALLPVEARKRR